MQNKMTRARIAQLAATHALELHCTQDGCAAMVIGPLPEEWLADEETGDVLCPQHRAEAVWYCPDADGALRSECPVHTGSIHGGEAEELRAGIEKLIERYRRGEVPGLALQRLLDRVDARDSLGYLERQDDLVHGIVRRLHETSELATLGLAVPMRLVRQDVFDELLAAIGIALDGVDQSAPAVPAAVLRETSLGLIGDETLDLDPTGEGR